MLSLLLLLLLLLRKGKGGYSSVQVNIIRIVKRVGVSVIIVE